MLSGTVGALLESTMSYFSVAAMVTRPRVDMTIPSLQVAPHGLSLNHPDPSLTM